MQKLGDMGVRTSSHPDGVWGMARGRLQSTDVSTLPYPGVATDYKPLLVSMLAVADGVGIVAENIFSGRFRYVDELVRMGADIRTEDHYAIVRGVERLSGAPVRAHDIRAGAALVVAGLGAEGETVVADAHHIDRGYDRFVEKLQAIGADVERVGLDSGSRARRRVLVGRLPLGRARRRPAGWPSTAAPRTTPRERPPSGSRPSPPGARRPPTELTGGNSRCCGRVEKLAWFRTTTPDCETALMLEQVQKTIEAIRPAIQADGGDIFLRGLDEDTGVVTVQLVGACVSCPASTVTLKAGVERIMKDRVPGVTSVEAVGLDMDLESETVVSL